MLSNTAKLEEIKNEILSSLTIPLKHTANSLVFGKGNSEAEILFIGEAPGAEEDKQGLPFVGAAGKQLNKLLNGIGLGLADVYIANILKYRPPNNRDPQAEEIRTHTPYLIKQILAIKPKVIVTLGNFSTKFVLAGFEQEGMKHISGITGLHGGVHDVFAGGELIKVMPMYHPAAMLYNPNLRLVLEEDFEKLGKFLGKDAARKDKDLGEWIG